MMNLRRCLKCSKQKDRLAHRTWRTSSERRLVVHISEGDDCGSISIGVEGGSKSSTAALVVVFGDFAWLRQIHEVE